MKAEDIFQKIADLRFVRDFIKTYPKANIYLVGGCIRDAFLGIESSDFDFVAENIVCEELIKFLETEGRVVNVYGRTFGVVKFRPESSEIVYDIALPRSEMYLPGQRRKHAQVQLQDVSINDDLARRDFTINAMAIDLRFYSSSNKKYLIDPYHGLKDIEDNIIRTVGNPNDRFLEDPTRILRGIRFAVQFGFGIDLETRAAIKALSPQIVAKYADEAGCELQRVSLEMIGQEFAKSLSANAAKTIELYSEAGLLKLLLPEVENSKGVGQPPQFHFEGDVYRHTLIALSKLEKTASFPVVLATLLHDIGKAETFKSASETGDRIRFNSHAELGAELAADICHRFCFPNDVTDKVVWMIKNHIRIFYSFFNMRIEKQKAFVRNKYFDDLLVLAEADTLASIFPNGQPDLTAYKKVLEIASNLRQQDRDRPVEIIDGREIIALLKKKKPDYDPLKHGKYIGALKKRINTLYDRNEITSKGEALAYLQHIVTGEKHDQKGKTEKRDK